MTNNNKILVRYNCEHENYVVGDIIRIFPGTLAGYKQALKYVAHAYNSPTIDVPLCLQGKIAEYNESRMANKL